MDDKMKKVSDSLLNKATVKKTGEKEEDTRKRMKDILSKRDQAVKHIEEYQDQTGIPQDPEIDGHFLSDEDINLDEFKEKENDKN